MVMTKGKDAIQRVSKNVPPLAC